MIHQGVKAIVWHTVFRKEVTHAKILVGPCALDTIVGRHARWQPTQKNSAKNEGWNGFENVHRE